MILHPGILALMLSSLLVSIVMLYACYWAAVILCRWELASGSELQLALERRTYLISTIIGYAFSVQILSLFLFVYVADGLAPLLVGAMCAAGTLSANAFGYPVLLLKMANCTLAGLWMVLNRADNRGYDYPLIRRKYLLLLFASPLILAEGMLQALFFLTLRPDIITSCCGALFSGGSNALTSDIAAVPGIPMMAGFYPIQLATIVAALTVFRTGRGVYVLTVLSAVAVLVSIISIISFISPYFYELPSHRCPFCLLQREYGHIGFILYPLVFLAGIAGIGPGLLHPFKGRESLAGVVPRMQRSQAGVAALLLSLWLVLVTVEILTSNLILLE